MKTATEKPAVQPKQYRLHANVEPTKFRGFLAAFLEFVAKKGNVTVAQITEEFGGRQFDGHKVNELRVRRYISYCRSHDLMVLGAAKSAKAGS